MCDSVNVSNDSINTSVAPPVISKRQQKKQKKVALWDASKKEFKKKQKEKRKQNQKAKLEKAGDAKIELPVDPKKVIKYPTKEEFLDKCSENCSILIDCNWENIHNDRMLTSLGQQVMYSYGLNRRAIKPCSIYLTGVQSKLKSILDKNTIDNWIGIHISESDYSFPCMNTHANITNTNNTNNTNTESTIDLVNHTNTNTFTCNKTPIYLTSESEHTLTTIDPNCIYIIGKCIETVCHV